MLNLVIVLSFLQDMVVQVHYMKDFHLVSRMEDPDEVAVETEHDGVQYYIESRDEWYFLEHDLHVNVDPKLDELIYSYEKA